MSQPLKELRRRIDEFYVNSTGRLSYPMCQSMLESEYPSLEEELKRIGSEVSEGIEADLARLEEARANLEAKIEHYESLNRRWNKKYSPSELRRYLS